MARSPEEVARAAYESGDAFIALLHDDVVFVNDTYPLPDVGHQYQGRAAVEKFCRSYWRSFTDYAVKPVEVVEVGDRLVVVQRESGGGAGSGISLQRTFAVVFHFRDEKIVRIEPYPSREEALTAARQGSQANDP